MDVVTKSGMTLAAAIPVLATTPTHVEAAHGTVITLSPFGATPASAPSPPTIAMARSCQASMPTTMVLSIVSRLRDV